MSRSGIQDRFRAIKKYLKLEKITINSLEASYAIEHLLRIKNDWTVVEITIELNKMGMDLSPYRIYTVLKNIKNDFLEEIKNI